MTRDEVQIIAKEIHQIIHAPVLPAAHDQRILAVLRDHGVAADWPSIQPLLFGPERSRVNGRAPEAPPLPTEAEVFATLRYVLCAPRQVGDTMPRGANWLFVGNPTRWEVQTTPPKAPRAPKAKKGPANREFDY